MKANDSFVDLRGKGVHMPVIPINPVPNRGTRYRLLVAVCCCLLVVLLWQGRQVKHVDNESYSIILAARELIQGRQSEPNHEPTGHVICPDFKGGLGNLMFQYASVYGLSKAAGLEMLVKVDSEMFQIFDIWAKVSTERSVCSMGKIIRERQVGVYDNSLTAIRPNSDYFVKGYLQTWRYFEPYKEEIRKQLRFRGDIERKAYESLSLKLDQKYGEGNYSSRTLVGVHVRRGNLLGEGKKQYGYIVADDSYMNKSMSYFRTRHKDVTFVVCSNDMKWSKANVTGSDVIFMEGSSREVDMAILSSLNHTIMTVGTFGWWSAWLANGETIYFKNFKKNGTTFASEFQADPVDHMYPGWIGM